MVELIGITKTYFRKDALKDICIKLPNSGVVGIIGRNGSGKTTLFKILAGLTKNHMGQIKINGQVLGKDFICQQVISYFPSNPFPNISVKEMVEIMNYLFNDFNKHKMMDLCEQFSIDLNDLIKQLSKGKLACLVFALTVSREVNVYILDEPFDGIDVITKKHILKNLIQYVDVENKLLLISSHEITDLERIIDQFLILEEGKMVIHNTTSYLIEQNFSLSNYYEKVLGVNMNEI